VSRLGERADFAYGNTRLRARWPSLLAAEDLELLAGRDVDGQLAALADGTPYAPDAEAALAHTHGLLALYRTVGGHLARTLRGLPGLYQGPARALVELHLAASDLHNLLVLLRGRVAGRSPQATLDQHVDVGAIGAARAGELASQPTPELLADLLGGWRLPDPDTAAALRRAWPDFERTGDLPALERHLVSAHERRRAAAAARAGADGEQLRQLLGWLAAARGVVLALRLREALAAGELDELPQLAGRDGELGGAGGLGERRPAGRPSPGRLDEALRRPDAEGVAAALAAAAPAVPGMRGALERWVRGASPARVERDLELARERALVAGARVAPLSLRVPLAWAAVKEAEVRRLRQLAGGAARGVRADVLRSEVAA